MCTHCIMNKLCQAASWTMCELVLTSLGTGRSKFSQPLGCVMSSGCIAVLQAASNASRHLEANMPFFVCENIHKLLGSELLTDSKIGVARHTQLAADTIVGPAIRPYQGGVGSDVLQLGVVLCQYRSLTRGGGRQSTVHTHGQARCMHTHQVHGLAHHSGVIFWWCGVVWWCGGNIPCNTE